MIKIERNFFDLIDDADDLIGHPQDRPDVHPEYQRGVFELLAGLTVGTSEKSRQFLAGALGLDLDVLYLRPPVGVVGRWYRRTPFRHDDSGDVGGDVQAGPAHSLSWQRRLADGTFETLTLYHFAAQQDVDPSRRDERSAWVESMIELIRHRNASDPGTTETASDYRYESRVANATLADARIAAERLTGDCEDLDPQTLWWDL